MRPTGLGSGFYKDIEDYGIFCGEWCIGRIYKTRTVLGVACPPKSPGLRTDSRAPTLDQAKIEFEASWKQWKAWAGVEETG